jgi:hypothetical protein
MDWMVREGESFSPHCQGPRELTRVPNTDLSVRAVWIDMDTVI